MFQFAQIARISRATDFGKEIRIRIKIVLMNSTRFQLETLSCSHHRGNWRSSEQGDDLRRSISISYGLPSVK